MFNRDERKLKSNVTKPLKDLIAVEKFEELLKDKKRQLLLQHISESMGLNSTRFDKLALSLIHNITRYCQNLPEPTLYYSHRGGLIDHALNRTEAALQLVRQILVLDKNAIPSEEQAIWLYALFSAAMLRGIGKLYTDYQIDLFDPNGQLIKRWQPLLEDMPSLGRYFYYDFLRGDDLSFRNNITLTFARQLMPIAGFTWIISNPAVFAVWLALLQEDRDGSGSLGAILDRANAVAIQREINDYILKYADFDGRNRMATFVDSTPEMNVNRERLMGAEFIAWVMDGLETGKIIINKIPMLMEILPTGVVMSPQLFDMFAQEHLKFKNKVAVQKAFLAWNLHLMTDDAKQAPSINAIPIDPAMLPEKVTVYSEKTGKLSKISSLNLVHNIQHHQFNPNKINAVLDHLSSSGKWVSAEENIVERRYDNKQRI